MSVEIKVKSIWDSQVEELCFHILKEFINLDGYDIMCHVHLSDIFCCEEKQEWCNYHVDFLITDKRGYPVLAIEINGPEHLNNADVKNHEKIKKLLFEEYNIPIILIPITEISYCEMVIDTYRLTLRAMIKGYLYPFLYRAAYPAYSWKEKTQYLYLCRKDGTATFYASPGSERTYSCEQIPELLNKELFD